MQFIDNLIDSLQRSFKLGVYRFEDKGPTYTIPERGLLTLDYTIRDQVLFQGFELAWRTHGVRQAPGRYYKRVRLTTGVRDCAVRQAYPELDKSHIEDIVWIVENQMRGQAGLLQTDGHPNRFYFSGIYRGQVMFAEFTWSEHERRWIPHYAFTDIFADEKLKEGTHIILPCTLATLIAENLAEQGEKLAPLSA